MKKKLTFRQANKEDCEIVPPYLYSAGKDFYDYLFSKEKSIEFIRFEFKSGKGMCGYKNTIVIELDGSVVGACCYMSLKEYFQIAACSIINQYRFFGLLGFLKILKKTLPIRRSIFTLPKKSELYHYNFSVGEEFRSLGIGQAFIFYQKEKAKKRGYSIASLDVEEKNIAAKNLYEKYNFSVIKRNSYGGLFSSTLRMELNLN